MRIVLILLIFLCYSCKKNCISIFSFEYNEAGHFIIPLEIQGELVKGIFDTGAQKSLLVESYVREHGIKLSTESTIAHFPFFGKEYHNFSKTRPLNFRAGKLNSLEEIAFVSLPDSLLYKTSIWGLDIINQFCWYFDTEKNIVTVSTEHIKINDKNFIAVPYKMIDRNMITSFCMYGIVDLDKVQIDTGLGAINDGNELYPVYVEISENNPKIPALVQHTGDYEIIKTRDIDNGINISTQIPFQKNTITDKLEYHGIFVTRPDSTLNTDGYLFIGGYEGVLAICRGGAFSTLYLDTKNQVLYLKPN